MRPLFFITAIFIFFSSVNGQSPQATALQKLYDNYPQEKIYAWLNKPGYVAGETIWFKIYVFSGYELSNISSNIYVELYNSDRKLVTSRLLPLFTGTGQGSIELDEKFPEGVYYLRMYTRWMLNFDESLQFIHSFPVINPSSSHKLLDKKKQWTATAFAEGGSLIAGINTKIAVRLYSPAVLPEEWSGYLFEEGNTVTRLAEFSSLDKNVASFRFTPDPGKKYFISITDIEGNRQTIALQEVKKTGIALQVENKNDSLICRLRFKDHPEDNVGYILIGHIQHQMVLHAIIKKGQPLLEIPVPTKEMYNGVLHLTLFENPGQIISERLVFVHPQTLYTDSAVIGNYHFYNEPRAENDIEIIIDSTSWGSYAISITDPSLPSSTGKENLLSSLWLSSDLASPVQDAVQYFSGQSKKITEALDALLITEKWKHFKWADILDGKYPLIKYLPHPYLSYTGTVSRNKKLLPREEINMILYYPDSSTNFLLAKTDSTGNFTMDNMVFEGELKAYYQANSKKPAAKNIDIRFKRNNSFFPYSLPFPESNYLLAPRISQDTFPAWVQNSILQIQNEKEVNSQYKTLQEVIVRSNLKSAKEQLDEKLSSGMFRSINEIVFDFINEDQHTGGYTNILSWLQGRVAGYDVHYNSEGALTPYIRGSEASIYLDEMRIDASMAATISITDVAMVKVFKGALVGAWGGGYGGTIAIYTPRGNMRPLHKAPALNNNTLKGYDPEKKFSVLDYKDKLISQAGPDTRDQLLWAPLLPPTQSITRSKIKFVNNDLTKTFRITVQGMNEKGFPVYFEKIINVSAPAF